MKLITLNLWGGQIYEPLLDFLKKQSKEIDVFCFQEVIFGSEPKFTSLHKARVNLFFELQTFLSEFNSFSYPAPKEALHFQSELLPPGTQAGQAIFIRKNLTVTNHGGFRTYETLPQKTTDGGKITGSCQWVEIDHNLTIMNLHGLWQKNTNKVDTPERLTQSQKIQSFLQKRKGKKILCGDFNLIPNGQAMKKLEEGMKNLVKKYGISSTRSPLYTKPEKFSDYVLASPDINIETFEVLPDIVSDHLALRVEFIQQKVHLD